MTSHMLVSAALLLLLLAQSVRTTVSSDSESRHGHRSKRFFFYFNPDAPVLLALLVNLPVSLALPTLVDAAPPKGRSLGGFDESESPIVGQEYPDDLFWEPSYEQELGKLQVYFSYLKIASVACQERLVCEVAASPDTYSPLSKLILQELRQTHGPVKPTQESLFWRYMAASATGYAYSEENCGVYYPTCQAPAKHHLNMPVLEVWKYLASNLYLKLV